TPSKLNAQGVQEQVPTVNTFIRSHTKQQHDEANRELERRWRSYDDMLPNDQFVSIIDKTEG
ncbi:hypothetical protein PMM38_03510, partial [Bifidobacterium pseudocatenulatum]|nr:hypothetical protein [Bifidobacterium pseudocatenulatum]MDB6493957.1 hypothetical protein [Bifidobacterium pseudocatenulatum]MDB6503952.1 hypothetical protein [Bifidobacterium pseudocatenulatum]